VAFVSGMFGVLGWIGYQQMPHAVAKTERPDADQTLMLEGDMAKSSADVDPFPAAKPVQFAAANNAGTSAFERGATAFRRPEPVAKTRTADEPNPFAAFERPTSPAAEPPVDHSFSTPSRFAAVPQADAGVVTLASNDSGNQSSSDPFAAPPQTEPESSGEVPIVESESQKTLAASPTGADDPFAAFATDPGNAAEQASPPSTVPGSFGTARQSVPVASGAGWTSAEAREPVVPVQFNAESAPAPLPVQGGFETEAKPVTDFAPAQYEPAPTLNRPARQLESSTFDQPAAFEPGAMPARTSPRPINARTPYSPAVERVQKTASHIPQPVEPANDPSDEKLHVVQQGETYWSIARQHYGAGRYFQALSEYNKPRISDKDPLKPGMKVLVPSANTLDVRYGKLMQASGHAQPPAKPRPGLKVDAQGQPLYVVGPGDTLGEISRRLLGTTTRVDEIVQLNREQLPDVKNLKIGMSLVMPADAAEVQSASSIPGRR
jgi:nucleoid-associated protein YgaU